MFGFARRRPKKLDHPLGNAASTMEVVREITERKGLDCLQGFSELLDALKTLRGLEAVHAFDVIDQLDRAARPYWRRATHEYHSGNGTLTNYQANRIWTTVGEYIVQLAEAYELCLARYETGGARAVGISAQLPRIVGRALRLRVSAQSWDYVRYASQFGRWSETYRLFQHAESRGYSEQKVALYRGGRLCTLEQEFMQALMLAVAAPHSMLPEQIDIADRIAARLAYCFSLSRDAKDSPPYFFDPSSSHPPAREQPGIRPPITARRFGPGDAQATLQGLAARAEKGELPLSEIGVERHTQDIVAPTLQHLLRYWCDAPPERRHSRLRKPQRITVVHGFDEVAAKVGNVPTAYPFVSVAETWLIENTGEGGIGALVANPHGMWATIGCLLAFRYPEASVWNLGIVRHLTEEKCDRFLGIEVMSNGGVAVSVHRASDDHVTGDDSLCVWLSGGVSPDGTVTLLLPRGMYAASSVLHMFVHNRQYLLTPQHLAAAGTDYEVARYNPASADG
jgi:hypothetical protein